jgi:cell division transport system permease protein
MTVVILILMLLSVNILVVVNVLTDKAISLVKDQIDVSVYFVYDASEEKIKEIKDYVGSFPEVNEIIYLDRDEVLLQFKEQYKDNLDILASLEELEENPLGPTMIVKTKETKDYQKITKALDIPEYENIIESKTFGDTEKAISRIQSITEQIEKFAYVTSILFAIISFFIIFNTVRATIYSQRIEITIKKLVGASNWFVRGPYVVEALIFSLISLGISHFMAMIGVYIIDPYITIVFGESGILTNYYNSNIILLLGIQFGVVFLLAMFSSLLAMRKQLKA